jgi:AcrR family transcriptional regulator
VQRHRTVEEALDHAVAIMAEGGVGSLSISEVARRMGMRAPSLYKYFASLHAVYDALFLRGLRANAVAIEEAVEGLPPGQARLRAGATATVRWSVEHPSLAQLLYWRPVPGFEPSPEVFAESRSAMEELRAELDATVAAGELAAEAATEHGQRLFTVLISGVISQQLANEPGVPFDAGRFTALTADAIDLFLTRYQPSPAEGEQP